MEGSYKSWHENGQLKRESNYKNGKMEGSYKSWYENGQQEWQTSFSNNKENGVGKKWRINGKLYFEKLVKNDEIIEIFRFDKNGKMIENNDPVISF